MDKATLLDEFRRWYLVDVLPFATVESVDSRSNLDYYSKQCLRKMYLEPLSLPLPLVTPHVVVEQKKDEGGEQQQQQQHVGGEEEGGRGEEKEV